MKDLFDKISKFQKEKILQYLEANTLTYKKNSIILSNVKQENIVGFVVDGSLQIIKTDYNGNETIIETLYENDVFGSNLSSISNSEYTILTKEDSKIVILYFDDIIKKELNWAYYNQFLKNLLEIVMYKFSLNNERINILTNKTIRNKLLAYFEIAAKKTNSKTIYLPFSFTELADYLAVDRSSMHRELKNLKEEGLIDIKNRRIKLNMYDEIINNF